MPKHISTPKQGGGGGYTFEDKVSASFLVKMLSGEPPLTAGDGVIETIHFQKRVDGWFLDDLVLKLGTARGGASSVGISIKSNNQLTVNGFPEEFTTAVWEQRLHVESNVFDVRSDYLALATSTVEIEVTTAWNSLVRKALDADSMAFADRIATPQYANLAERQLFLSLHCPVSLGSSSPADTAELLKRLRHFQFDFENVPSESENAQIGKCRELLNDADLSVAESLWTSLKQTARELATSGGDLTRKGLASRLRPHFSLKEFPDYAPDWLRIAEDFDVRTSLVRDNLGGSLSLDRDELKKLSPDDTITVLVGASGSGKSVLAKQYEYSMRGGKHRMWLNATDLNSARPNTLLSELRLSYSILELVSGTFAKGGTIVIDGVERLNGAGIDSLTAVLKAAHIESGNSTWHFIFTCVFERWDVVSRAIQKKLGKALSAKVVSIEFDFGKHRRVIIQAFPNLTALFQRPQLLQLFKNLKVLDLLVSNAALVLNPNTWVGETDFIDWFWEHVVSQSENGPACSRFAQKLSREEADRYLSQIPVTECESDECRLAPELEANGVLSITKDQFQFAHDLLGDWSRSRLIASQATLATSTIHAKAENPRWHKAIRLYGLRLLEDRAFGLDTWSQLLDELSAGGKYTIEQDLILESVIFAANADERLSQVWPMLTADMGARLTRLLRRFLHVGTLPDPLFVDGSTSAAAAVLHRYPFWPLWGPVLILLHNNRAEAIPLSVDEVTQIARLWIENSADDWPLREEAAAILLDATAWMIERMRLKSSYSDFEHSEKVFSRLLVAASVRPDEVDKLALSLSERCDESPFSSNAYNDDDSEEDDSSSEDASAISKRTLHDPWPLGPRRRVNHHVQNGFLTFSNPLKELFREKPDAAIEVLLALLIKEPLPVSPYGDSRRFGGYHFSLDSSLDRDWRPGMFFHGPFLDFLRINPKKGIEAIVALVNFATERWRDDHLDEEPVILSVAGEERPFFGSNEAYFWYRDSVSSEGVLSSALMALEKWLYDQLDQELPVAEAIDQVLEAGASTALLGVLAALGRRNPSLLKSELRAILPAWELLAWEENYRLQQLDSLLGMTMMQWVRWGEKSWEIVQKWHALPHRQVTLLDVLLRLFVGDQEMRKYLRGVRSNWQEQLESLEGSQSAIYLEKFVRGFDENNWQETRTESGVRIEYVEPRDLQERLAPGRAASETKVELLRFPYVCRTIIDERKQLEADELEEFWTSLQKLAAQVATDDEQASTVASATLGGVAVLMLQHRDWLSNQPDREKWCWDKVEKILTNPPPCPAFHVPDSISNYLWNNFAALLFPVLLSEDPDATGVRAFCADFVLAYNYSVVQDLMQSAFEHRFALGDDFYRLQHLVLLWSGVREIHIVTHGGNSVWGTPDVPFDIGRHCDGLVDQFVNRSLSTELTSLSDVATSTNARILAMVKQQAKVRSEKDWDDDVERSITKRIMRSRGFDAGLLRAAFSWLTRIDEEPDIAARQKWTHCVEDFLRAFLRPLGGTQEAIDDEEDYSSFYSTPTDYERWFFEVVAILIPKLEVDEHPERLWQPILSFGLDRMHWVDSFLSQWFLRGSRVQGVEDSFFREWKRMLEFAIGSETWRKSNVRSHHHKEELQLQLLGISFGEFLLNDARYLPYVTAIKPQVDSWIDRLLPNPEAASNYARFLTCQSAANHLRDGMKRLADASANFKDWYWQDFYHLDSSLLHLLEYDWKQNSRLIKEGGAPRQHFSTLLKLLADRQIPGALELQDRIALSH